MSTYQEQIKNFEETFNHNFEWQDFNEIKPPKRGCYDILEEEDDNSLHLMNGYYSEIADVWIVYPFYVEKRTLKYWAKNPLDSDDVNENGEIICNNETDKEQIEFFDFLDVKASTASDDLNLFDKLSDDFAKKYGENRWIEIANEIK